jgi:hypothetical protein
MSQTLPQPYWKRFAIALCSSAGLVFACSLSMQLHALKEPEWMLAVAGGVLVASIPGSALSALAFRKSQLALILGAQLSTVMALAAWFGLRG